MGPGGSWTIPSMVPLKVSWASSLDTKDRLVGWWRLETPINGRPRDSWAPLDTKGPGGGLETPINGPHKGLLVTFLGPKVRGLETPITSIVSARVS